jgi:hypothetical protein
MHVDEREEEEERGERQPRVEEREPCVEETTEEEETELGVLAPGVARSPASEREDRRRDS